MFGTAVSAQAQTLDQWVASADNIIVGTATAIKPNPFSASLVTCALTETLKRPRLQEVTIVQPGELQPTSDLRWVIVASAPRDPLLLPGQDALPFLTKAAGKTNFSVQAVTGTYAISEGSVEAALGNPFAVEVSGRAPAGVKGQIASRLAAISNSQKTARV